MNYQKYTWVCTGDCDALIEYTIKDGYGWPAGEMNLTCRCNSNCTLLSVVDATIDPSATPTTEEEKMETTTNSVPDTYNPDLAVTYKVIRGFSDAEYETAKVTSIEWDIYNGKQSNKSIQVLRDKIENVKTIIHEAYADSEDQETLRAIAEALDIELTRTVEWTASIEVSGTIELDLLSPYDADLESEITDAIYAESHHGNIEIVDQEVCHVREC
jgi:hypothetical protein